MRISPARTEVRLTVTDWASESAPGAPVGRTRLVNYFSVRPYYEESAQQTAEMEEYLSGAAPAS